MESSARWVSAILTFARGTVLIFADGLTFLLLCFRSPAAVAAENLFLRKQLDLYIQRKIKPRRATNAIRFTLAHLSRFLDWRNALTVVQPDTLIRWHRRGFRVFWKWKSRSRGRPSVPADVQKLIVKMATNNPTWGDERIADELLLKIGVQISPRTIRRYIPKPQFRESVSGDEGYRFVIHDRDRIYSQELDQSLKSLGLTVLKTPYKSPQANAFCERLIGSARRECFDFMIPLNETHIRQTFKSWTSHYNRGRPHSSLGPGTPDKSSPKAELQIERHHIPKGSRIVSVSILSGLHHEYRLEKIPA
jgi:transposase InsO family protein